MSSTRHLPIHSRNDISVYEQVRHPTAIPGLTDETHGTILFSAQTENQKSNEVPIKKNIDALSIGAEKRRKKWSGQFVCKCSIRLNLEGNLFTMANKKTPSARFSIRLDSPFHGEKNNYWKEWIAEQTEVIFCYLLFI